MVNRVAQEQGLNAQNLCNKLSYCVYMGMMWLLFIYVCHNCHTWSPTWNLGVSGASVESKQCLSTTFLYLVWASIKWLESSTWTCLLESDDPQMYDCLRCLDIWASSNKEDILCLKRMECISWKNRLNYCKQTLPYVRNPSNQLVGSW